MVTKIKEDEAGLVSEQPAFQERLFTVQLPKLKFELDVDEQASEEEIQEQINQVYKQFITAELLRQATYSIRRKGALTLSRAFVGLLVETPAEKLAVITKILPSTSVAKRNGEVVVTYTDGVQECFYCYDLIRTKKHYNTRTMSFEVKPFSTQLEAGDITLIHQPNNFEIPLTPVIVISFTKNRDRMKIASITHKIKPFHLTVNLYQQGCVVE